MFCLHILVPTQTKGVCFGPVRRWILWSQLAMPNNSKWPVSEDRAKYVGLLVGNFHPVPIPYFGIGLPIRVQRSFLCCDVRFLDKFSECFLKLPVDAVFLRPFDPLCFPRSQLHRLRLRRSDCDRSGGGYLCRLAPLHCPTPHLWKLPTPKHP